jgi:ABC-type antimicrobial peptide transport system permease subunit
MKMVLSQGFRLASAGVALGLLASIGASRGLAAVFPSTGTVGPETYLMVAFALMAVVTMAAYVPAYGASKVDPNVALRQE